MICALRSPLGHILASKFWATTYEQGESTMKVGDFILGKQHEDALVHSNISKEISWDYFA
jgi:hypothetical protein